MALFPATDDFSFVRSKNRFLSRLVCFLLYFEGVIIARLVLGDISKKYFIFILIFFVYRKRRN